MDKSDNTVLLPCPFCGGLPSVFVVPSNTIDGVKITYGVGYAFVNCTCGVINSGKNKEEAISKWNRRTK